LIPRYQGFGAAVATLVSYGLAVVISCFFYKQTWEIGIVLVKAIFAPFRVLETLKTYTRVKALVDLGVPSATGATVLSESEITQDFR
jgi:hypothetical protein